MPPPSPHKLANPSCFVDLCFRSDSEVYMSKRDVCTCFHTLKAPASLQPYFGRPPVTLQELMRTSGCNAEELLPYIVDLPSGSLRPGDKLYPASSVWPMGFSWSSACAQYVMTGCVLEAGPEAEQFLGGENTLPPPGGALLSQWLLTTSWRSRSGQTMLSPSTPHLVYTHWTRSGIVNVSWPRKTKG